jgi:hypothetical protein
LRWRDAAREARTCSRSGSNDAVSAGELALRAEVASVELAHGNPAPIRARR